VVVGLIVFTYAFYIALFPLFKTIRGGLQVLKKHGDHVEEEEKAFIDERKP